MDNKCKFKVKENIPQLAIILVGALILIGGCFQNSIWFDEAYTVGLMRHSFFDSIKWATHDVHPHLYYILLKFFTMVFGTSMYAMRIFSVLGALLFASLGLTHIRCDFGKKVGFWFSFCALFSASTLVYAWQIRMYTWAAYFVTLAAIYAYRMFNMPESKRCRIMFLVFSVMSAYTHHFGLFTVAVINVILLVCTFKEKRPLKTWLLNAAIQIGCYIPGALVFLYQISLGGASWITIGWPDLVFDLVSYHLLGDIAYEFFKYNSGPYLIVGALCLLLYVTGGILLYRYAKSEHIGENKKKALKAGLCVYFGTILFALTVSLFRVIYYIRYTVVICGLLFFSIAVLIAGFKKNITKIVAAAVILSVFGVQAVYNYKLMYDPSANAVHETLDESIKEGDVFFLEDPNDYVIAIQYPDNVSYFYNMWQWGVQNAYRAFGENAYVVDTVDCPEIENLGERVWVIGRRECYNHLVNNGYTETAEYEIYLRYHKYYFTVHLMEK